MADSGVQREVEDWIRREWMPRTFGKSFSCRQVSLTSGGAFMFDAVSVDGKVVANISTSGSRTARGRFASGKIYKVRSDIYFLLLSTADRKLVLLTEQDMNEWWLEERKKGRVPECIEFWHVRIPDDLNQRLEDSRGNASDEVSPE